MTVPIRTCSLDGLSALAGFLSRAFPEEGFDAGILRTRVAEDPDYDPELSLTAVDDHGKPLGWWCGVIRPADPAIAHMKWLGVDPAARRRGIGTALADAWESRARERGAEIARVGCSVPGYLAPGIATRHTGAISFLWRRGYAKWREATNMTVDLQSRPWALTSGEKARLAGAGIGVRAAERADAERVDSYMGERWDGPWRTEVARAFANDPPSLFLGERDGRIIGFAACDVNQFGDSFGPTGVDEEVRGAGLGGVLLKLCLDHLHRAGRRRAVIGAVGPVPFYHRVAGARISDTFWMMDRQLMAKEGAGE